MKVYRGPHFQVVLWRFYLALFGKAALFAVINVIIPLHVKYIVGILSGGADGPKRDILCSGWPSDIFLLPFRNFSFWAARDNFYEICIHTNNKTINQSCTLSESLAPCTVPPSAYPRKKKKEEKKGHHVHQIP